MTPLQIHLTFAASLLMLAGCTTPRSAPPDVRLHSSAPAEDTVACLVRVLDANPPLPLLGDEYAHHALLIVPGKVYEVTHQPLINQNYTVRVSAEDGGSAMELRAMYGWVEEVQAAIAPCGEVVAAAAR